MSAPNAISRWGMFTAPQGSIVTNCHAHVSRCASMLNWRAPSSPACGAYGNDDDEPAECRACEGSGRIPFEGTPGAYYRDGEKYDPPGWEDCEACGGTGTAS